MIGTKTKLAKAFLVLAAAAGCSGGRAPEKSLDIFVGEHLRVRLISDSQELIPGAKHQIGVLFEIDPGWHLYAPSRNDSGLPILLDLSVPEGFSLGPPLWPTPHRLVSEGPLLDHVYEGEALILFELGVPADARPGGTETLRCRGDWLICGTGCIPGEGSFSMTLPIGKPGAAAISSSDSAKIRAGIDHLPAPVEDSSPAVVQEWHRDTWSVRAPGATSLTFIPDETCVPLVDLISEGTSTADRLDVRVASPAPADGRISGVLAAIGASGPRHYRIDTPLPRAPA